MSRASNITVVNVGYRSTNYWVISAGTSRVIVDLGWPGSMGRMLASLRRMDIPIEELRYALATHYHIDHAGLAQEFKDAGVLLLVPDVQVEAVSRMKTWIKPTDDYLPVRMEDNRTISLGESRALLANIDIAGEILHTPGHSDDSVSLLLDGGAVFTGDLTRPAMIGSEDPATVQASWSLLRDRGATRVYPGHGPIQSLEEFLGWGSSG